MVAAIAAAFVLLVPMGQLGYDWLTACRGEERAVFEEFPQYSPHTPENLDPRPDLNAFTAAGGDCFAAYRTPDVATEVLDHFEGHLRANGWEVRPSSSATLYARRGNYEYRVSFTGDPTSTQEGTPVSVTVRKL